MARWNEFAQQAPELAEFGKNRFQSGVAYLGTLRPDGSPRVHPVTPIVGEQLFLFMEPTSPKGKDLLRDPRYTLHCAVENSSGGSGEFYVSGYATLVSDAAIRQEAVHASSYTPKDRYILFSLTIHSAFMNCYTEGGATTQRWKEEFPLTAPDMIVKIKMVCEAYRTGWLANDADAVLNLFAEDAVLLPHHGDKPVIGKSAIRNFWWPPDAAPATVRTFQATMDEVRVSGDIGYVWGEFSLSFSFEQEGREKIASNGGTYLMLMRQQADGEWLITHRMWDDPVPQIQ